MSLEDFKKNIVKIKELSADYETLLERKNNADLEIRNLKIKYRESKIERDIFGEYNKKLGSITKELDKRREEISKLCKKNSDIIGEELKDAF